MNRSFALLAGLSVLAGAVTVPQTQLPTREQAQFFESKIRPILENNCNGCHGKDVQLAGLRVDSRAGLLKGGVSGPALKPGNSSASLLMQAVRQSGSLKMPKGGRLKPDEIESLDAWVKMGAPWPTAPTQPSKKSWWSFEPVRQPQLPEVKNKWWVANPVDSFVMAGLEAKGVKPAPAADRRTLIRRLSYDLLGLPPTAAEVGAFVADKSPKAYEKVVDRLLASPHYGERWGRHWLDVARYADTKGYVFEEDRVYHNAYTYRDWVISAINRDLPYDEFVTQQLAADTLPEVQHGDDKTALAALGFLTVGRRFLNNPPDIIDDRIDVTMRGFEGLTVACARCHDHKFDPIPTQDYYSLYAVFASSEEALEPISPKPVREPWVEHAKRVSELEHRVKDAVTSQIKALRSRTDLGPEVKQALQTLREDAYPDPPKLVLLRAAFDAGEEAKLAANEKQLAELQKNAPAVPEFAMAMHDRKDAADGVVFKRGNPGNRGEPAPRRFLAALSRGEREHWVNGSGRLELARSIGSRENPLTARVLVNRVWQHHFGAAIVRTPSDFGHQGELPTDPKLLDYLATRFMQGGWSIKKLHKLIVMSSTYRQSSTVSVDTFQKDPENRLWSRMNRQRLDFEQMRDSVMFSAGKLDLSSIGGKSVDLWNEPFTRRRAIYGYIERQNLPFVFKTFDFASPDTTSAQRFLTTVPQQALFFMNSPFVVEQARAVAERPEVKLAPTPEAKVRAIYRLLYSRDADKDETAAGIAFLSTPARVPLYTQSLMMTNEYLFVD